MKSYFQVDDAGKIVGPPVYKSDGDEIEENYFEGWSQDQPFYNPKWDFTTGKWVESRSADEQLQAAKDQKEAELNEACNKAILDPFTADVSGVTYWFSNDNEAQKNFDKADSAFARGRIAEIPWTAYDSDWNVVRIVLTPETFEPLYMAHLAHIQNNIAKFRDFLMPQVYAAATAEEVELITW